MHFWDSLGTYTSHTAIIDDQQNVITYQKLIQIAENFTKPIKQACLVFILCQNNTESLAIYLGCLRARIVPLLLSDQIEPTFLNRLIQQYQPKYIFLPKQSKQPDKLGDTIFSGEKYALLKTPSPINYPLHENLALLLPTSGSTGSPKLVRLSHNNLASNTQSIVSYLGISTSDRPITTMPMHYSYGLSIINSHLAVGASLVITESSFMDSQFWQLMKQQAVSTFGGVPYHYEMLKKLRFERMDLPNLRYTTQAGGCLNPELMAEFIQLAINKNKQFIVMYGQTEATARMSYLPWPDAERKLGSIGKAIPGGCFRLADKNELAGELIYQGNNVCLGYAENYHDLVKGDENQGILHTGDLAKCDQEGYYYIVGRKTRFIKMYGHRLNLYEVEALLKTAGHDCACAGVDNQLKIYLTKTSDAIVVKNSIAQQLGINTSAITTIYLDRIPRNNAGKILYTELEMQ